MITKEDIIAVVGASKNPRKYGNEVMRDLISKGYTVYPVNPNEDKILELKSFKNLKSINAKIDFVVFVVPPEITEKVLEEVKKLKIPKVWMQPGSESEKAIKFCEDNKIECIHNSCIMFN
ncbi:CoA-binding protein [archaeon]|nr:CoA-binding protein [archaeon]